MRNDDDDELEPGPQRCKLLSYSIRECVCLIKEIIVFSCGRLDSFCHINPWGSSRRRHTREILRVRWHQKHSFEFGQTNGFPEGLRFGRIRNVQTGLRCSRCTEWQCNIGSDDFSRLVLRQRTEEGKENGKTSPLSHKLWSNERTASDSHSFIKISNLKPLNYSFEWFSLTQIVAPPST